MRKCKRGKQRWRTGLGLDDQVHLALQARPLYGSVDLPSAATGTSLLMAQIKVEETARWGDLEEHGRRAFYPDAATFTCLINGFCMEHKIKKAIELLRKMGSFGCTPNVITFGTLITGLRRTGNITIALQFFEEMVNGNVDLVSLTRGIKPNVVAYNTLIYGLCNTSNWEEAKTLFMEMLDEGVQLDVLTFNMIIDDLCKNTKMNETNGLLQLMINRGVHPNTITYSTILASYFLASIIDDARKLFDSMASKGCEPNVVSYNIFMDGLCLANKIDDAKELFASMLNKGCMPNVVT
ncbi:pentatricopeptide repeat-containing protein At5g41170, mitochondrial-like [Pistacia vera]|uniref:pentatricopeptide repeat-containing protein At5g41170, mitochondrial-like n=1 Tax=Pistacia vera TaxID=55513 RepID=UPI001262D49A|nr:pentatricopeptide repeat-containing protein At5g41170, mitochondrial-like [Pistacia vera]